MMEYLAVQLCRDKYLSWQLMARSNSYLSASPALVKHGHVKEIWSALCLSAVVCLLPQSTDVTWHVCGASLASLASLCSATRYAQHSNGKVKGNWIFVDIILQISGRANSYNNGRTAFVCCCCFFFFLRPVLASNKRTHTHIHLHLCNELFASCYSSTSDSKWKLEQHLKLPCQFQ